MSLSLLVIVLTACTPTVWADLPVHCLRHEVVGTWRFVVGKSSPSRTACGHFRPDDETTQPARAVVDGSGSMEEMTVLLAEPNVATIQGQKGGWTMIYDEGFEVQVGKRVFFAFSNFTFEADKKNALFSYGKQNVSHCGQTMVGWYSSIDRTEFGCYYGEKTTAMPASSAITTKKTVVPTSHAGNDAPLDKKMQSAKVSKINKKIAMLQLSWKARAMPQWNGRTIREINGFAGLRRTVPTRDLHRNMLAQQNGKLSQRSFLQREATARSGKVPESYDWSDVNGMDYLEPVMDQGDCGSCYDASTMRMLTARHKINLNNTEALPWSINFPLFCGEYNQGCKGGYGFLTTKWSQDVGLIPATCMRYDTKGSCKLECDLEKELTGEKRYRAANHRYVSSWYGNFASSVERNIMEEIYSHGPHVVSFEPAEDFMFYSEGVYKSTVPAKASTGKLRKLQKHIDFDQEWERVDHAVLAVGFGEDDGQKYWLIQNSWGQEWGEDGFFRILRGVDESGVESIPEAADVVEDEQHGRQVAALFVENTKVKHG